MKYYSSRRLLFRRYRGPSDMVPGKEYSNIWEVLHEFPSLARLHVFLFATEHIDHYVAQVSREKKFRYRANDLTFYVVGRAENFILTSVETKLFWTLIKCINYGAFYSKRNRFHSLKCFFYLSNSEILPSLNYFLFNLHSSLLF